MPGSQQAIYNQAILLTQDILSLKQRTMLQFLRMLKKDLRQSRPVGRHILSKKTLGRSTECSWVMTVLSSVANRRAKSPNSTGQARDVHSGSHMSALGWQSIAKAPVSFSGRHSVCIRELHSLSVRSWHYTTTYWMHVHGS
jgi:hypothetical protein